MPSSMDYSTRLLRNHGRLVHTMKKSVARTSNRSGPDMSEWCSYTSTKNVPLHVKTCHWVENNPPECAMPWLLYNPLSCNYRKSLSHLSLPMLALDDHIDSCFSNRFFFLPRCTLAGTGTMRSKSSFMEKSLLLGVPFLSVVNALPNPQLLPQILPAVPVPAPTRLSTTVLPASSTSAASRASSLAPVVVPSVAPLSALLPPILNPSTLVSIVSSVAQIPAAPVSTLQQLVTNVASISAPIPVPSLALSRASSAALPSLVPAVSVVPQISSLAAAVQTPSVPLPLPLLPPVFQPVALPIPSLSTVVPEDTTVVPALPPFFPPIGLPPHYGLPPLFPPAPLLAVPPVVSLLPSDAITEIAASPVASILPAILPALPNVPAIAIPPLPTLPTLFEDLTPAEVQSVLLPLLPTLVAVPPVNVTGLAATLVDAIPTEVLSSLPTLAALDIPPIPLPLPLGEPEFPVEFPATEVENLLPVASSLLDDITDAVPTLLSNPLPLPVASGVIADVVEDFLDVVPTFIPDLLPIIPVPSNPPIPLVPLTDSVPIASGTVSDLSHDWTFYSSGLVQIDEVFLNPFTGLLAGFLSDGTSVGLFVDGLHIGVHVVVYSPTFEFLIRQFSLPLLPLHGGWGFGTYGLPASDSS
ncbi:predicted protein [Plenodomus lingam JN3]|uniref:Predicted protein n=1 Tax=Leptosphaeria maculans (strain JN3 / isolate v23.1.3 / race Av1-4-5-6-7-8) TaxID=985895 RepID=E5AEH0_LEPMJ|nr:predicted protein [Plenodomus lingam JN3]CBY01609.1 predicted protein [Plenodomus lingam JN3]